ncbi:hypothetical protein ACIRP7_19700 [Streptomyces sp. NPDC102270]|uniref:hypothetical protein n=1 Tax=Streptomyces sp. NPDC102270 TaxID=3366150 RepID=UPI0037FA6E17
MLVVRSDGRALFFNAGIFRPAPVSEVTEESFDEHADLNFKDQYVTLQKAPFPS